MSDLVAQLVGALEKAKDALEVLWVSHHANRTDYAIEEIEAALSAAKDGGWVAVPVEPTPQMTWAATVTADREWCYHVGRDDAKKLWAAMLAARPFPNPPKEQNT